jgi:hypothetical protein
LDDIPAMIRYHNAVSMLSEKNFYMITALEHDEWVGFPQNSSGYFGDPLGNPLVVHRRRF